MDDVEQRKPLFAKLDSDEVLKMSFDQVETDILRQGPVKTVAALLTAMLIKSAWEIIGDPGFVSHLFCVATWKRNSSQESKSGKDLFHFSFYDHAPSSNQSVADQAPLIHDGQNALVETLADCLFRSQDQTGMMRAFRKVREEVNKLDGVSAASIAD